MIIIIIVVVIILNSKILIIRRQYCEAPKCGGRHLVNEILQLKATLLQYSGAYSIRHGGTCPLLLHMAGYGGQLTKLYWPSRKRWPKRLLYLWSLKSGWTWQKNFLRGTCAPPLSNSFRCHCYITMIEHDRENCRKKHTQWQRRDSSKIMSIIVYEQSVTGGAPRAVGSRISAGENAFIHSICHIFRRLMVFYHVLKWFPKKYFRSFFK